MRAPSTGGPHGPASPSAGSSRKKQGRPIGKTRAVSTDLYRRVVNLLQPSRYLECTCCGTLSPSFLPHGVNPRENARCPSCGSLERHRLQCHYLRTCTNLFTARLKVLHFAPEAGLQRLLKSLPNLIYHSADLSSRWADERFDICDIPHPTDSFDVVLCSHVLEHVPDDRKAMSELFRVMKPGSWGLIEAPIGARRQATFEDWTVTEEKDRERIFGQRDHVRIYGHDYYDRLRAAGFTVTPRPYGKELPASLIAKYRVWRHASICLCTKPTRL
jgi:hypothetical protein